ncbi:hypothetical protein H6P81_016869 [Aristolochia fimbriata]|uniref:Uncharacterized protein n=1 Tax=Aristolochia fimbriata TaxID=158543 RepID=A0AAV7DWJ4_ARIFI|nr:hypothetical protein H6P81_016869 [Aristolochia fimbriata]
MTAPSGSSSCHTRGHCSLKEFSTTLKSASIPSGVTTSRTPIQAISRYGGSSTGISGSESDRVDPVSGDANPKLVRYKLVSGSRNPVLQLIDRYKPFVTAPALNLPALPRFSPTIPFGTRLSASLSAFLTKMQRSRQLKSSDPLGGFLQPFAFTQKKRLSRVRTALGREFSSVSFTPVSVFTRPNRRFRAASIRPGSD